MCRSISACKEEEEEEEKKLVFRKSFFFFAKKTVPDLTLFNFLLHMLIINLISRFHSSRNQYRYPCDLYLSDSGVSGSRGFGGIGFHVLWCFVFV